MPGRRESPEVIDPDDIDHISSRPEPFDPPAVTIGFHHWPVIRRVAPQLPCLGEEVGRHAGHERGATGRLIELELTLIRPDIRTIERDEDGNIPDHPNPALVGIATDFTPLPLEQELDKLLE